MKAQGICRSGLECLGRGFVAVSLVVAVIVGEGEFPGVLDSAWGAGRKAPCHQDGVATDLAEIVEFRDLSSQYVLGLGVDSETGLRVPFAVYDKTLSTAYHGDFWKYLVLSSVGIAGLNGGQLTRALERPNLSSLEDLGKGDTGEPIPPVMIIDLKNSRSSYRTALRWAALTNLTKAGLNEIPFYGPPQAAAALLERAFDFVELLYLHHHAQALALVSEALDGNQNSPFYTEQLSPNHLRDAIFYLVRSQTILSSLIKNGLKKPDALIDHVIEELNQKRMESIRVLEAKKIEVYPFKNSYFALGVKRDPATDQVIKLKIYSLVFTKLGRKNRPFGVVDFLNPNREMIKRNHLQAILMGLNFLYFPIPGLTAICKLTYKEVVVREFHRRQMQENGYLAHRNHQPDELASMLVEKARLNPKKAQELESVVIAQIEARRLNPVDLTSDLIPVYERRVEKWIRLHDLSYGNEGLR